MLNQAQRNTYPTRCTKNIYPTTRGIIHAQLDEEYIPTSHRIIPAQLEADDYLPNLRQKNTYPTRRRRLQGSISVDWCSLAHIITEKVDPDIRNGVLKVGTSSCRASPEPCEDTFFILLTSDTMLFNKSMKSLLDTSEPINRERKFHQ